MPNKRADNKKQFTAAFEKVELEAIDAMARELGMTRTEFLRLAAMKEVKRISKDKKQKDQ